MSIWVRSKYSEEAAPWQLAESDYNRNSSNTYWEIRDGEEIRVLLRSEYVACPAPERWEVCTREVVKIEDENLCEKNVRPDVFENVSEVIPMTGYRWAWQGDALVIERKVEG